MSINRFGIPSIFCSLAIIASCLVQGGLLHSLPADANPGVMRWETVTTPNSEPGKNDVLNPWIGGNFTGSEVRDLSVGSDGRTLIAAVTVDARYISSSMAPGSLGILLTTSNGAISWITSSYLHLTSSNGWTAGNHVYNVLIAPDDPKLWAVTAGSLTNGPTEFWVTTDAGASWSNTQAPALSVGEAISTLDISIDYGTGRDFMLATRTGSGGGRYFILKNGGFSTWMLQSNPSSDVLDFFAVRFSPTYNGDQSVVVILSNSTSTFYNIGLRDINNNSTLTWVFPGNGIEIKSSISGASPSFSTLASADLSLPSDFSGQSASLRRTFVSLNVPAPVTGSDESGVFRIDDSIPTTLLSTSSSPLAQICSIAFFGTFASGKMMAGPVWGSPCNATVTTLFADTPCTCGGSCLYKSLKPATGAANQGTCSDNSTGIGSAVVAWSPNGSVAYVVTGTGSLINGANWWNGGLRPWISTLVPNDESALSISRNNGDTWNQLSLIDTTIDWFNDVAVSADCTTVYLASVHRNTGIGCNEFDSVWRSTVSPAVASPLPALVPIGTYWERIFTHTTSFSCNVTQSDLPLLRTIPSCTDSSDGGIVAWAAQYASDSSSHAGLMAWSPDYGDYWAIITPRDPVQDFTFESNRIIYNLSPLAMVQKLVFTGTAWSTTMPSSDTGLATGHTIAGRSVKVMVGAAAISNRQGTAIAYSADGARNWSTYRSQMPTKGNVHVIFDVDFEKNYFIYAADDNVTGTVYRNTAPAWQRWTDVDMMSVANGATGISWPIAALQPPHPVGIFGVVQAWTGNPQPALYAAHDQIYTSVATASTQTTVTTAGTITGTQGNSDNQQATNLTTTSGQTTSSTASYTGTKNSAVCRTLNPRDGMPKPGIVWDCLDIFAPVSTTGVSFTLEPSSLKSCGCCSLNTNTTLWAIDNESGGISDNLIVAGGKYMQDPGYRPDANQGMLWSYTDCLAKKAPALRNPPDQALVGADPVTGRNQQIDLSWEQLCLSSSYLLQIAKDKDFTLRINPEISNANNIQAVTGSILINTDPVNVTNPAVWLSPGSLPEAGSIYYWRIRSYKSATGQIAVSPWSQARSFKVKPGFIARTPYLGVQLLSPDNGCMDCKARPASFSWSPWKEATRYEFVLARDAEFNQIIKKANTTTTGYEYDGTLEYDTNYFWRVRAIEINGQPISSDWSATFSFKSESAPPPGKTLPGEPPTPIWVWIVIGIGAVLVIVTLVLIFRTRW